MLAAQPPDLLRFEDVSQRVVQAFAIFECRCHILFTGQGLGAVQDAGIGPVVVIKKKLDVLYVHRYVYGIVGLGVRFVLFWLMPGHLFVDNYSQAASWIWCRM